MADDAEAVAEVVGSVALEVPRALGIVDAEEIALPVQGRVIEIEGGVLAARTCAGSAAGGSVALELTTTNRLTPC